MVQQNLVSYIMAQLRQGRRLEEINDFLIRAGYEKTEVESSVQYVINLQTNPRLAEEQRIQQLADYIQKQLQAGYGQQAIANFLITRGYPYYEVNSALQQATLLKKETKVEHKLVVFALVAMFIMTAAVTIMYFKAYMLLGIGAPEKLLDVEAEKLTTIVQQGGELTFQVKLINFGYEKRFDVVLEYKVIDRETQGTILEKSETVALSTTLENIVKFEMPEDMKPGKYVLRVDATYKEFTATSGFIFDLLPKELAAERIEEIRKQVPEIPENITEIPELAPIVPEAPEAVPTPIPAAPEAATWYQGKTRQQAFEQVKAVSVREPQKAVEMCKTFRVPQHQRDCVLNIATFKKDGTYCKFLDNLQQQDNCIFQMIMETKQHNFCEQITDVNLKTSCSLLAKADKVKEYTQQNRPEESVQLFKGFSIEVTPSGPQPPSVPQFG
ncbi:hypothetical protein JW898_02195 [Candidatus Woesearchaeota archaeon]|nr:hypothetical protein [Candidatus Woesearchaeota archaeon]